MLAVLLPQSIEQSFHGNSFIHKTTDIALWLGQTDRLGESSKGQCLLLRCLVLLGWRLCALLCWGKATSTVSK
jgi:hypothetical protein